MGLIPKDAFVDPRPFGLPPDSREIILDLPLAPSVNRLHRRKGARVYRADYYDRWIKAADAWCLLHRQYPRERITGPFEIELLLSSKHKGDGDNRIKAVLDWLQSREIIQNDVDCRKGSWEWVPPDQAPAGCRIHLRTLHQPAK